MAEVLKPVNGYQTRVPFRWSWKEGWKTSMFLMPLRQPGKPVNFILINNCVQCLFLTEQISVQYLLKLLHNYRERLQYSHICTCTFIPQLNEQKQVLNTPDMIFYTFFVAQNLKALTLVLILYPFS